MKIEKLSTDILIIGGGTAGCYAALTISENSDKKVLICEKAHRAFCCPHDAYGQVEK